MISARDEDSTKALETVFRGEYGRLITVDLSIFQPPVRVVTSRIIICDEVGGAGASLRVRGSPRLHLHKHLGRNKCLSFRCHYRENKQHHSYILSLSKINFKPVFVLMF
jgi:hypothetical protein